MKSKIKIGGVSMVADEVAYYEIFLSVSAILFKLDPMNISESDNTDEYDPEAIEIVCRYLLGEDLSEGIKETFSSWFGLSDVESTHVSNMVSPVIAKYLETVTTKETIH